MAWRQPNCLACTLFGRRAYCSLATKIHDALATYLSFGVGFRSSIVLFFFCLGVPKTECDWWLGGAAIRARTKLCDLPPCSVPPASQSVSLNIWSHVVSCQRTGTCFSGAVRLSVTEPSLTHGAWVLTRHIYRLYKTWISAIFWRNFIKTALISIPYTHISIHQENGRYSVNKC